MIAFASNSVFCRLALATSPIDPATFTFVRIASGVVMLWLILLVTGRSRPVRGSWPGALALFSYAVAFSYAYISLPAAAGALLLFGAVQATMVITGLVRGERLAVGQWAGFILALAGLTELLVPGTSAPPAAGAGLMLTAGIAWGVYSLIGRGATDPLSTTAGNFLRCLPMTAALLALTALSGIRADTSGLIYAVLSGAVASGLGYSIWYAALPGLTPAQGASVQLSVPVITALAGTMVLGEPISLRLALSSLAILGGITFVILGARRTVRAGGPK